MNLVRSRRPLLVTLAACLLLLLGGAGTGFAASTPAPVDAATQKRIDGKSDRLLAAIKLDDPARVEQVRGILADWFVTLWGWHEKHDSELTRLWTDWNKARAVVPKDEFPGEVIAHRIDDVYGSLKPAYQAFLSRLSAELTPEQIDRLKETWSRSPGMQRTYEAYLQIVPDLTPAQQEVIRNRMLLAREAAMLTDSDKEIVNIYKVHKVKVEAYVGTLQWAKLHSAYANRAKGAAAQR